YFALALRHLSYLFCVSVRNGFAELKCDRIGIRRAVPAVAHIRRHGPRIAARKGVFRFGERAHRNGSHRTRQSANLLSQMQRRPKLLVLLSARAQDAAHQESASLGIASTDLDRIA